MLLGMVKRRHVTRSNEEERILQLERRIKELQETLSRMEVRLAALETGNFNRSFLWRIPNAAQRRRDAIVGQRFTCSTPFYTGQYGYRVRLRAYLNGHGIGYRTHLSIFFVLMRGEYDPFLRWPFRHRVTLFLLNQRQPRHVVHTIQPIVHYPHLEMNIASGCPQFARLSVLDDENYVKDDVLYIRCIVDTTRIFHP